MSVLHDAIDVALGPARDSPASTKAHINDKAALVTLLEEFGDLGLLFLEYGLLEGHGSDPDRPVNELFGEQAHTLEFVNVDLASHLGLNEGLVELELVELAQEVALDPHLLQLLHAAGLRKNHLVKEVGDALVSDEIPFDGKLADQTGRVRLDTFNNTLQSSHTDPVVAKIKHAERCVRLESLAESSCTIDVKDVAVKRQILQGAVGGKSIADGDHTGNTKLTRAQVQVSQACVCFEGRTEEFGSLLGNWVLRKLQVSDLALSVRVVCEHISQSFAFLDANLSIFEVQHQVTHGCKLDDRRPLRLRHLLNVLEVVHCAAEGVASEVEPLQVEVE